VGSSGTPAIQKCSSKGNGAWQEYVDSFKRALNHKRFRSLVDSPAGSDKQVWVSLSFCGESNA